MKNRNNRVQLIQTGITAALALSVAAYAISCGNPGDGNQSTVSDNAPAAGNEETCDPKLLWDPQTADIETKLLDSYRDLISSEVMATAEALKEFQGIFAAKADAKTMNGPAVHAQLNRFIDSFFFLEYDIAGMKFGKALSIPEVCTGQPCIELRYSGMGLSALQANLKGLQAMLLADGELSFVDYMSYQGAYDLAARVTGKIDLMRRSIGKLQAVSDDLGTHAAAVDPVKCKASTSTDRQEELCAILADANSTTKDLREEFVQAMNFCAPVRASGDID